MCSSNIDSDHDSCHHFICHFIRMLPMICKNSNPFLCLDKMCVTIAHFSRHVKLALITFDSRQR